MKIGLFAYSIFPENRFNPGIENLSLNLAKELSKSHEVHIFESGSHDSNPTMPGVSIHRTDPITTFGGLLMNQLSFARRTVREHCSLIDSLDIVHDLCSLVPIFLRNRDVPVLTTFHHYSSPESLRDYAQMIPVPLLIEKERFADQIVAVSEFAGNQVQEKYGHENVRVIPNGVNTSRYSPSTNTGTDLGSEITLLFVGPLTRRKNIGSLLEAFPILQKNMDKQLQLNIVGEGLQADNLQEQVINLGIDASVSFKGYVEGEAQLVEEYREADLFVFPSLLEGFGMVVVEALACGTPVATSAIEPLISIVDDAGAFFDPTQPENIATTIHSMLGDEQQYINLCKTARERAQRFRWSQISEEYVQVYEKMNQNY